MKKATELSIILPIYNPYTQWENDMHDKLLQIKEIFKGIDINVILINDGSSKNLSNEIKQLQENHVNIFYINYPNNKGKGYAVKQGLLHASSKYYIYTDWDFPFGVNILYTFYELLKSNQYDVIFGKRSLNYYKKLPLGRKLISVGLRLLNFVLLGFKDIDTQAGIKGINNNSKPYLLATKTNSFIFEYEFAKKVLLEKMRIKNVKISINKNLVFTNFSLKTIVKEAENFIKCIFKS